MLNYFGSQGAVEKPKDFFGEENYIICRGATDLNKIDELFDFYNNFISVNSSQLYLRQSSQWEANRYTKVGGVSNGFLDPHSYAQGTNGEFSDKILKVLSEKRIQEALCEISGIDTYSLAQTMFLDHTTTRPHQDWIYLDSIPNGYLIAAWVALEDIFEEGIRFFVYPGTQNHIPESRYKSKLKGRRYIYSDFLEEIDRVIASDQYAIYAPPVKKGDIFFWGSRIIHGSQAGSNDSLRRRSLASHFLPDGYEFGNLSGPIPAKFTQKHGLKFRISGLDDEFNKWNTAARRKSRLSSTLPSGIGEVLRTVFSSLSRRR